jgi:hypothetical protein
VTKDFNARFIQACKERGKVGAKLKRNWALNFMATNDPNGGDFVGFKILKIEASKDTMNDQVYFSTIEEKAAFIEYCNKQSINASDFFRTCEYNFIMTGDPTGQVIV